MQFNNAFALVGALLLAASGVQADTCTTVGQRREFRQLTHTERLTFLNAVKALQAGPVRKSLQAIDPSIMHPYWDWAYDYRLPDDSIILSPAYYGGNGNPNNNQCVPDGVFADWKPNNGKDCIGRRFSNGNHMQIVISWGELRSVPFANLNYQSFNTAIERVVRPVEVGIGDQFTLNRSADDPIFFLHHAFVDKLWADWQKMSASKATSYGGSNYDGQPATQTDVLGYGYKVEDVMDTRNLCYTYVDYNGENNPTTAPPTTNSPTTTPPTTTPPTTTPTDSYSTTSTSS
ncbi:hypothetical protein THASP1DRAFT_30896, partial [Thamnocephalis sphaerospora]